MCRDITLTFTCTPAHPTHKMSFSQPCPKCKPSKEAPSSPDSPGSGSSLGLSLTRSISRAIESKPDPEVLRAYTLAANRPCEACDDGGRKVAEPPSLKDLGSHLGERHTLSMEQGTVEGAQLSAWVERL